MSTVLAPSSTTGQRGLVCPACRQALQRRPRHFGDRMLALFEQAEQPLRRYACTAAHCGWQGLLRGQLPRRPGYLPAHWL